MRSLLILNSDVYILCWSHGLSSKELCLANKLEHMKCSILKVPLHLPLANGHTTLVTFPPASLFCFCIRQKNLVFVFKISGQLVNFLSTLQ